MAKKPQPTTLSLRHKCSLFKVHQNFVNSDFGARGEPEDSRSEPSWALGGRKKEREEAKQMLGR